MIFSFYFKILTLYPFLSARRMTSFFFEDTSLSFRCKNLTRKWLKLVAESEIRRLGGINIILCSDLFISVDSVRENSLEYGTEFENELNRVIVHGILHLIGYDDHCDDDIALMRKKEDYYLSLRELL